MKIFIALKQRNYVATYAGLINILLQRGHLVRLVWPDDDLSVPEGVTASPNLSIEIWEPRRTDEWAPVATSIRRGADYLRYLEQPYQGAAKLRARAFEKLLRSLSGGEQVPEAGWSDRGLELSSTVRQRLQLIAGLMEQAIPSDPRIEALLSSPRPDVVLVSPLVDLGSSQTEIIKSAQQMGIPTGMVLFSWDNLSTKGGLHLPPDRLFVWNERQRQEAVSLHGYPIERAIATGAPRFDEFFKLVPETTRQEFCAPLGLDPAKPILIYLGSSKFVVTGTELPFIASWVRQIRTSEDARLRECNILIRPHPDVRMEPEEGPAQTVGWNAKMKKGTITRPFDDPRAVVVRTHYRRAQGFYDALHHSSAVVGLNTSAALEAAIVGRPVFTIVAGDGAADGQVSTLHFRYLLEEEGGCVVLSSTFEEHLSQLTSVLRSNSDGSRYRQFACQFLRPLGEDIPAAETLANAIEREYLIASA
ncbi:MAG: hypothetical protein ABL986_06640 [Vicinamibacterales bacterium]